jgi:uncharacterized protein (DUF736 family)
MAERKINYTIVGALWKPKSSENENLMLTGTYNIGGIDVSISIMKNTKRKSQSEPAYRILSYGVKDQGGSSSGSGNGGKKEFDDEVPF